MKIRRSDFVPEGDALVITIGSRIYRIRRNHSTEPGRWVVTYGPIWGEYDLSARYFASMVDVRAHLQEVADLEG